MRTQSITGKRSLVYEEVKQRLISPLQNHPDLLKNVALLAITGSRREQSR